MFGLTFRTISSGDNLATRTRERARLRLSRLERIRTECTTMQLGRSCLKGEVSPRRNPRPLLFRRGFAVNSATDHNGFKLQVGASRLCLNDPRFSDSGRYRSSDRCISLSLSLSRILGKSPRAYPHACDTTRQIFAGERVVGSCDSLSLFGNPPEIYHRRDSRVREYRRGYRLRRLWLFAKRGTRLAWRTRGWVCISAWQLIESVSLQSRLVTRLDINF